MTTLALDPIIPNVVFTLNLFMHLRAPRSSPPYENPSNSRCAVREELSKYPPKRDACTITWCDSWSRCEYGGYELPMVSVLVPLYREGLESIHTTFKSLADQDYPKDRFEVLFIVEPEDVETITCVAHFAELLRDRGIEVKLVTSDGKLRLKPHALNAGLKLARGEVICVFDADDRFDGKLIREIVLLMAEKGYDVVQPKIFRSRKSLVGSYLMLDCFAWQRKFVPALYGFAKAFPLSGEALFIKRKALDEVGGFPEVLTEDAHLAIQLAEKEKRFGLADEKVYELAPRGWRSHWTQRLRWFRGYLTCLSRAVKAELPWKKKLALTIPFLSPITCAFSLVTWACFIAYWLTWALLPDVHVTLPWMFHWLYTNALFYWSAFLAYIGNAVVVFSSLHSVIGTEVEGGAWLAVALPFYWMFLGMAALASVFKSTRRWGKTER